MSERKEQTRAEAARQRRAQRSAHELKQTRQRAVRAAVPPVTSRLSSRPVTGQGRRGSPRNQYNIAFGMNEARLRSQPLSLEALRADWRVAAAAAALVVGLLFYAIFNLPFLQISSASVTGNNRLSAEEINAVLNVSGRPFFMVNVKEVHDRLLANYPELESAQVTLIPPATLNISVVERTPVILWQQDGGMTWIDRSGVAFIPRGLVTGLVVVNGSGIPLPAPAPADPNQDGEAPVSAGPAPFINRDLVGAILALAPNVPADSAMIYDPDHGLGWKDSRGWEAFFGTNLKDMPLKARVYEALVAKLISDGKSPVLIDVSYPSTPYYRMADSGTP